MASSTPSSSSASPPSASPTSALPTSASPPSALPPPCARTHRERKSTNKYTVKNNRYRDHLKALEGPKLVVARARAANNTYICRARAAFIKTKMAELERLAEDARQEAYDEIGRRSRQHSVLSMLYLDIHWVQKAHRLAPAGPWPTISEVLRDEGIPRSKYNMFNLDLKMGSREWKIDLSESGVAQRAAQNKFRR
ncbi:hypothetical protein EJ07DRAFT_174950 [Lizonia empirigonia]|nr:hypothetical protein EJ07DRAFT_174950 [Lizonia empirigonia]